MTLETPQQRHLRTVADLTAEYAKEGYEVTSQPGLEDTPGFLRPYLPDLVAIRGDERWIVDVLTPGFNRDDTEGWSRLRRHAAQAGWHFRIVVPRLGDDDPLSYPMPDAAEIEAGLADPAKLAGEGQQGAALMLAWSLFEAAARRQLLHYDQDPGRPATPLGLLKMLVSLGDVDEPEFDEVRKISELRNQVAHGLFRAKVPAEWIALLESLTRRLLADQAPPAPRAATSASPA
jgi:REase_AHJR-like